MYTPKWGQKKIKYYSGGIYTTAQKEQKFNKYDQNLKNQIIQDFYLSHYSYKLISIKYSIPIGTLATWISHYIQIFHLNNLSIIKFA